jgi:hypothetical protein
MLPHVSTSAPQVNFQYPQQVFIPGALHIGQFATRLSISLSFSGAQPLFASICEPVISVTKSGGRLLTGCFELSFGIVRVIVNFPTFVLFFTKTSDQTGRRRRPSSGIYKGRAP